jgi:hypothetical protein
MRLFNEVLSAGALIFADGKVKDGEHVYVYSTSWQMAPPPSCFYPWTTVAPMNRDFSKAISFQWNRDRRWMLLPFLHPEVVGIVRKWRLERLYKLALLSFARGGGQRALMDLAQWHERFSRTFPLSELVRSAKSFAPVKWPKPEQMEWARSAWADIDREQSAGPQFQAGAGNK